MSCAVTLFGCGLFIMMLLLVAAVQTMNFAGWAVFLTGIGLFWAGIRLRILLKQRRLMIGADGIRIKGWLRKPRFYAWDEVIGFVRDFHTLKLRTTDGDEDVGTHISPPDPMVDARPAWAPGLRKYATLNHLVAAAKTNFEQSGRLRCAEVIEGRAPAEWRAALQESLESGDYRDRGLSREDLLVDLENPAAPKELRAIIASLIRPRLEEEERFRRAFAGSAAPKVRVAIEEAMEQVKASEERAGKLEREED